MIANEQLLVNNNGWPKKSLRNYVYGFILCMLLTLLSFGTIRYISASKVIIYSLLTVFAVMQMAIQSVFFLGLSADKEGKWNFLPFLFTILIIIFLVGGTEWIMYNLSALMMDSYLYR